MNRACLIIPAFNAEKTLRAVIVGLLSHDVSAREVIVVDDGSSDDTAAVARACGVQVVRHSRNRGKGAALRSGLSTALSQGFHSAVTVDADGQHRAEDAMCLLENASAEGALVLGIRSLKDAGAPRANQLSNGISNYFLSRFTAHTLLDTQCGLRRYPVAETLRLGARSDGYAFEAEVILRAIAEKMPIVQVPIRVHYPKESERVTHFDSVKDPARIIVTVLGTLYDIRNAKRRRAS